ncbi:hypothetical protein MY11210_007315 [Beauveria gryllotalpidicola]
MPKMPRAFDQEKATQFWQRQFSGLDSSVFPPLSSQLTTPKVDAKMEHYISWPSSAQHRWSYTTLCRAAVAILLSRYSFAHVGLGNINRIGADQSAACRFQTVLLVTDRRAGEAASGEILQILEEWLASLRQLGWLIDQLQSASDDALSVKRLDIVTREDRAEIESWNSDALEVQESLLHSEIVKRAADFSSDPAVFSWDGAWTYSELDHVSSRLAAHITSLNLSHEQLIVPIYFEKSKWVDRLTGVDDAVRGTPIANRNRPELECLIGFFVNTQCMRITVDDNDTFEGLVRRVRKTTMEVFENEDVPFERVASTMLPGGSRDLSQTPLAQLIFAIHSQENLGKFELQGLESEPVANKAYTRFDAEFHLFQTHDGLNGYLNFATELFKLQTMQIVVSVFLQIRLLCRSTLTFHPIRTVQLCVFGDVGGGGGGCELEVGAARTLHATKMISIPLQAVRSSIITQATVFNAACALVLSRETGAKDVVFGRIVSGRQGLPVSWQNIVGPCTNAVPVATRAGWPATANNYACCVTYHDFSYHPESEMEQQRVEMGVLARKDALQKEEPVYDMGIAGEVEPDGVHLQVTVAAKTRLFGRERAAYLMEEVCRMFESLNSAL